MWVLFFSRVSYPRFSPFAIVSGDGMAVVDKLYSGYGEGAPGGNGKANQTCACCACSPRLCVTDSQIFVEIFPGPNQGRIQSEGNKVGESDFFIGSVMFS